MAGIRPTLLIDFGTSTGAAMTVTDQGAWLVPDPGNGAGRWPCAVHWDGQRVTAGSLAQQRGQADPGGYTTDLRRSLDHNLPVTLGARALRPVELVAEFFAALRLAGQRSSRESGASQRAPASEERTAAPNANSTSQGLQPGPIERAVVTVPASLGVTDPLRSQLVGAAEASGFTAVELLIDPAGAVWAPGSPLRVGDTALVYDLGATFEAALIRVGDDLPEVIGHASVTEHLPADPAALLELTLACCRDLLGRLGVSRTHVAWVLPVGGGARLSGLAPAIENGLGIDVAPVDEPELAVIRGAAAWLPRSGPRMVLPRASGPRMVPLVFTIPGGTARLLRWLVEPNQPYEQGATVARVRLAGGAVWDLTARSRGTMDEVLVPGGQDVRSGEWLALVRPT